MSLSMFPEVSVFICDLAIVAFYFLIQFCFPFLYLCCTVSANISCPFCYSAVLLIYSISSMPFMCIVKLVVEM